MANRLAKPRTALPDAFRSLTRSGLNLVFWGAAVVIPAVLGAQTTLSVSELSVDFGTVAAGQEVTQTITVTNTADASLYVIAEIPADALSNFDESNNCSFTDSHARSSLLAAGASCTVTVKFTPVTS